MCEGHLLPLIVGAACGVVDVPVVARFTHTLSMCSEHRTWYMLFARDIGTVCLLKVLSW